MPFPEISVASLYLQIVSNTVDEMEILREAISNSVDAGATVISIDMRLNGALYDLEITDNGHGIIMELGGEEEDNRNGIEAIWGMGKTEKLFDAAIGEKGLGSKTFFRANRVEVSSVYDNQHYHSYMDNPLEFLEQNEVPEYQPEDPESNPEVTGLDEGTKISLFGVTLNSIKENQSSESIVKRVQDYIQWKTAAGSFKTEFNHLGYLRDEVPNIDAVPQIFLRVTDNNNQEYLHDFPGLHPFGAENINPDNGPVNEQGVKENSKEYCQPFSHHYSHHEGLFSWQVKGTVLGGKVRERISHPRQGETRKHRFGLYLCKDFIPIERPKAQELISSEYYFACQAMLNSQQFDLDASRNNVTNIDTEECQQILESFSEWFKANVAPTHLANYRAMSAAEDRKTEAIKKVAQMQEIRNQYPGDLLLLGEPISGLEHAPSNEYTTAMLLGMMVESGEFEGCFGKIERIGQHVDKSTDLIALDEDGNPLLVEIEHRLSSLFTHRHPVDSYDVVVVWDRQNFPSGHIFEAPWGAQGNINVRLREIDGKWSIRWGAIVRPIIVLRELIDEYLAED